MREIKTPTGDWARSTLDKANVFAKLLTVFTRVSTLNIQEKISRSSY